jgi:AcrR family transcriptional regulator
MVKAGKRPLRADAESNRAQLLASTVRLYSKGSVEVTLDAIAREAGVGIGTLYRHFPTREALIEATYRNELSAVCDAVPQLLASLPPEQAMRQWMDLFLDFIGRKLGMADALRAVIASGGDPYAQSRTMLGSAIEKLLEATSAAGVTRQDVEADDVLMCLGGVALAVGERSRRAQAGRMLDLLMDGLRYRR